MKVLSACQSLLTNSEVLQVLQERGKAAGPSETLLLQHLSSIVQDTDRDKAEEPETLTARPFEEEEVGTLMEAVRDPPFNLTRIEILQMINLVPKSAVEVHLLVENCDERLTEDQIEDLLRLIRECLHSN